MRRRPDRDGPSYDALNDRMWNIVSSRRDFGLIGITGYKREVERAAAQQRGREDFFLDYWGFAVEMVGVYELDKVEGRREIALDSSWRRDSRALTSR